MHFEDVLDKSEKYPHYTKKELNAIRKKVDRLQAIVGGIKKLTWPIGAIVLVDVNKEQSALKEAVKVGVPVVAMVDTNADPSLVDYVIPANDDAPRSISVILEYLEEAVEKGLSKKKAMKAKAETAQSEVAANEATETISLAEETDDSDDAEVDAKAKEAAEKKVKSVAKAAKVESSKEEKPLKAKVAKKTVAARRADTTAAKK